MLIVLGGLPGSGKTRLARAVAAVMPAAHVRIDAIESALLRTGLVPDRHGLGPHGYVIAAAVAGACLDAGTDVVIDAVNPVRDARRGWVDLADRHGTPLLQVEVVCSDPSEHERRVEQRESDLDGLQVPSWQDVVDRQYEPWPDADLVLDTCAGSGDLVDQLLTAAAAARTEGFRGAAGTLRFMASARSPATEVRQAKPGDRPAVTATVTAAFAADPAWSYILGADSSRLAAAFTEVLFDLRVGSGDVWVTDDVSAVAMWEPPGGPRLPPAAIERLWQGYRAMAGEEAWQRMQDYDHAVAPARPTTPYWYLGVLATRPDRQGEGLGTAVMEPVLAMADRDGAACCLETCTTANRDFYRRRGFTDTTEVRPPDGPTIWWLRRDPRVVP